MNISVANPAINPMWGNSCQNADKATLDEEFGGSSPFLTCDDWLSVLESRSDVIQSYCDETVARQDTYCSEACQSHWDRSPDHLGRLCPSACMRCSDVIYSPDCIVGCHTRLLSFTNHFENPHWFYEQKCHASLKKSTCVS